MFALEKSSTNVEHLGFPYHTYVHCKGYAPAAPRRARVSISVPFSRLPLSRPLSIFGLVSHYLTNNLINRRLILRHRSFIGYYVQYVSHIRYYPQFSKVIPVLRADYRRVTEHFAEITL